MFSEKTLRRRAEKAGYSISKGFQSYLNQEWGLVRNDKGERVTGYNVIDNSTGLNVLGSYNDLHDHAWQLEDVQEFLQGVYEENGLEW